MKELPIGAMPEPLPPTLQAQIADYLQQQLGKAIVAVHRKPDQYIAVSVSACLTAQTSKLAMHYMVSGPDTIISEVSLEDALEKAAERYSPLTIAQRKRAMGQKLLDEAAQLEAQ